MLNIDFKNIQKIRSEWIHTDALGALAHLMIYVCFPRKNDDMLIHVCQNDDMMIHVRPNNDMMIGVCFMCVSASKWWCDDSCVVFKHGKTW